MPRHEEGEIMAGATLALRRLAQRDNLSSMLLGYAHAGLITSGPWMMTVIAVAAISLMGRDLANVHEMAAFRSILIYNFAFSLVISGPILLVATRFLADSLYTGSVEVGRGILVSTLALVYAAGAFTAIPFHGLATDLAPTVRIAAIANYFVVAGIWVGSVFQVGARDLQVVTAAFAAGMALAVGASFGLSVQFGMAGMVWGFTAGLALVQFTLVANILRTYPNVLVKPTALFKQFSRHWALGLAGIVAPAAVWADKWIMWLSPESRTFGGFMMQYPLYDSAMFLAFLTMVPAMSVFFLWVETDFLDHYRAFYQSIEKHDTMTQIRRNHQQIVRSLTSGARKLIIFQAVISATAVVLAPAIIGATHLFYTQMSIFRLGTLGAGFHVSFICISILLLYFDLRRLYLWLQLLFLVVSAGLTAALLPLGFTYYGLGYFVASALCFSVGAVALKRAVSRLPYLTFVANNPSAR
jgi:uncharacterized membrane protein